MDNLAKIKFFKLKIVNSSDESILERDIVITVQ